MKIIKITEELLNEYKSDEDLKIFRFHRHKGSPCLGGHRHLTEI